MRANVSNLTGGCGIMNIWGFNDPDQWTIKFNKIPTYAHHAGFALAAFIESKKCKEAYNILKSKYPILYQSKVRINRNTGNQFFFCIYDIGDSN